MRLTPCCLVLHVGETEAHRDSAPSCGLLLFPRVGCPWACPCPRVVGPLIWYSGCGYGGPWLPCLPPPPPRPVCSSSTLPGFPSLLLPGITRASLVLRVSPWAVDVAHFCLRPLASCADSEPEPGFPGLEGPRESGSQDGGDLVLQGGAPLCAENFAELPT